MKKILISFLIFSFGIQLANADCSDRANYNNYDNISWSLVDILTNLWNNLATKNPEKIDSYIYVLSTFSNQEWLTLKQKDIIWVLNDYFVCRKGRETTQETSQENNNQCQSALNTDYKSIWSMKHEACYMWNPTIKCTRVWKNSTEVYWKTYIEAIDEWLSQDISSLPENTGMASLNMAAIKFTQDAYLDKNGSIYTPDWWRSLKFYIPWGTTSFKFLLSWVPSLWSHLYTYTFVPDNYEEEITINRLNPVSFNNDVFSPWVTYKRNLDSFVMVNFVFDKALKEGGWVYLDFLNSWNLWWGILIKDGYTWNRQDQHSDMFSSITYMFDKQAYETWRKNIKLDENWEVADNNCLNLVDTPKSWNPVDKMCYTQEYIKTTPCSPTTPNPSCKKFDDGYYEFEIKNNSYVCWSYPTWSTSTNTWTQNNSWEVAEDLSKCSTDWTKRFCYQQGCYKLTNGNYSNCKTQDEQDPDFSWWYCVQQTEKSMIPYCGNNRLNLDR